MEWVLILALGFWLWLQSQQLDTLARRLKQLEARVNEGVNAAPMAEAAPVSVAPDARPPAAAEAPLLLETPIAANAEEPLLLDTPLPPPVNDHDGETAPPTPRPEPVSATITQLRPARPNRVRQAEQWVAQNAFAWIAGGAFALGAALLVAFAAQSGFFTPSMRLVAAVILGGAMIAASEWVLRKQDNALVAALLAGAGAATFYVTAWAAYGLYHYIDWTIAAALLGLCALLLTALSQRHGQALGVLAIGAALLAPALTDVSVWPSLALTLYLCAVGATGAALAALRRWAWAAVAVLVGLYAWFAVCIAADEIARALALIGVASLAGAASALRPPLAEEAKASLSWQQAYVTLPAVAICAGSVFMIWTWLSIAPNAAASPIGPALVAIGHVALAALAVRMRAVAPATFAVAVGALVLGLIMYMRARVYFAPGADDLYFWPMLAAGAVVVSAFGARPHRHGRVLIAAAGAIGAALPIILAAFSRPEFATPAVWAPLFAGAALTGLAAVIAARQAPRPEQDWAVDLWTYAGAALALIGMESLAPAIARPAGHAGLALLLSLLALGRGWRGAGHAALAAAAALALTHALAPDFVGPATTGEWPIWRALMFIAATAAFLFGAGELASRRPSTKTIGEALNTAAILTILLGLFLALRWAAMGGIAVPLDGFSENALRALMLMAAGYIVLPRGGEPGRIARLRGDALMGAGLLLALLSSALAFNPWWGGGGTLVLGPPIFNAQALAFAAPAALAFAAARRLYRDRRFAGRIYAGAGAFFAILWASMEIRRAFHAADMASADIGLLEGDCYGLLALLTALAIAIVARSRAGPDHPFAHDLGAISRHWSYAALGIGVLILVVMSNPWWGAQNAALSDDLSTGFATLTIAAATAISLILGRALSRGVGLDSARFAAAAAAALFALTFGHDAIRWLYQRGAMDDNASLFVDLEGFAHAIWPLAFVIAASELTMRAPGRDTVRSYLYDLQAIWGACVWPALVWAALGLWFVFNPWWGSAPAFAHTPIAALLGLASFFLAAALSAVAPAVPHIAFRPSFERAATIAWVGHLFVALSLVVRHGFHGADMRAALEGTSLETWAYSALWALFGASVWGLGVMRRDATLRWLGLGLLLFVAVKVGVFDTATLGGVIRAASVIGLAVILTLVALAARRFGGAQGSRE